MTLNFEKMSKRLDLLFVLQFPSYADDLTENVRIWQDGGCERVTAVVAFWPTLTYFCDCDIKLNDRSKIIHISKAIMTNVKPPGKLVHFELLLASSPTDMTLTSWKSAKVTHLIFGHLFLLTTAAFPVMYRTATCYWLHRNLRTVFILWRFIGLPE